MINSDTLQKLVNSDLDRQGFSAEEFFPGMSAYDAAAVSIRKSIVKKWAIKNNRQADQKALDKFLAVNETCSKWTLPEHMDSRAEMLLNGFKQTVWDFWHDKGMPLVDNPLDYFAHGKVGPGANRLARGGDFYTKLFASPLTCSDLSLYRWYRYYAGRFPEWANAENIRLQTYGDPHVIQESRLSFVPKNVSISRCICIEPTLNTYAQLGFADILNRRLANRFGIDLQTQQLVNRDLARLGSITDNLATIDLSSASDSISLRMLKWALPTDFMRHLEKLRCPKVALPDGRVIDLQMVSTMGNGYTFPLQTILFSCVVVTSMRFRGIPLDKSSSASLWGVYGDDIICPREVIRDVLELLGLLGFVVNDDKSFVEGPFRESCGSDFFLGFDIRGIYVDRLETASDFYSAINRLILFSTKTGIGLENTVSFLLKRVKILPVPPWSNSDSGIRMPLELAQHFKVKYKAWQGCWSYSLLEAHNPKIWIEHTHIVVPPRHKTREYNLSGLLITYLQGSIEDCSMGTRGVNPDEPVRYRRKRRTTFAWDGFTHPLEQPSWLPMRRGAVKHQIAKSELRCQPSSEYYEVDWGRWRTCVIDSFQELMS